MALSKKAILEVQDLSRRAEVLARGTASQRKEADILCQRISTIKQIGLSTDEVRVMYTDALVEETRGSVGPSEQDIEKRYRAEFDEYVRGERTAVELRDFLAGTQSITFTDETTGGAIVPFAYDPTLYEAMAQVDPVTDKDVVSFTMTPTATLQPSQISGYDLSTITAVLIGETVQQTPQTIPTVNGSVLQNTKIFKASFAASWEAFSDIPDFATKIVRAGAVALARKIGLSVISGHGGVDINGVTQNLSVTLNNATAGKITLTDITNWFFAINRFYRASPKCGWLVSDGTYKLLRNAVDGQGRPLLDVEGDDELLMGKPVHVSPSMATAYSSIGLQGALIFGDLSHLVVRASRPTFQFSFEQAEADITKGEAMYIFRCRADASLFDPSGGVTPPLAMAAIS